MSFTLSLGPVANMQTITTAWSNMTESLEAHAAMVLDLSDLVDVDLSLVQLVEAARQHALRDSRALRLSAPANPAVTALLRRAGFLTDPSTETLDFWFHGELPQ
ncbi:MULTISPECIES: STAS domain-containing protein [unclassified Novosphingobium]|uniref:STAS domain-containing protein n=1 Tax=unclassified Novosphingobium TaxID=2644732 RepID=UPI000D43840A|nr:MULTISPECIES: STAS domain-containing protein [unclassified Novosphingobium]PTR11935.1 STAS domain-containing protein [Novosphingobium sp. GV055]PUB04975.1 STAS domain-containing protein [Novosphingobium sp. GV061]PUB21294.1 STAS domain-containing protein [Novosphingobium sp. GV079]PUB43020.1 STAS domain-containing protein [Novosphingobium sp. GV027]